MNNKKLKHSNSLLIVKPIFALKQRKYSLLVDKKYEENIENFSSYLKSILIRDNSQISKDKKNEFFFNYNINSKIISEITFDFNLIKYILSKPKRNPDETLIIKVYLSTMSFLSTSTIPLKNDKLLHSLSLYLKVENKIKDSLIFRYGTKGSKFYIILKGEVSILILTEIKQNICFKDHIPIIKNEAQRLKNDEDCDIVVLSHHGGQESL